MASFQARQRDPLLDQGTQAMLERRGRELFGVALVLAGLAFALMLGSYSHDDPGWMVATDEPARNILGRFGAAVASTLIIIGGKGVWGIAVILTLWGGRFILHRGAERALGRVVFAVLAVALASVYAATLVPGADWPHAFGLGGLFGDTVLGALLGVAPVSAGFGLKLISLLVGVALLVMGLFVTGFDQRELRAIARWLLVGLVVSYSTALTLAGKSAQGTARAAQMLQERIRERREAQAALRDAQMAAGTEDDGYGAPAGTATPVRRRMPVSTEPTRAAAADWGQPVQLRADMRYGEPVADLRPVAAPPRERTGLLARMPQIMRRMAEPDLEPELVEPVLSYAADLTDMPSDERIRARISDVIRSRARHPVPEHSLPNTAAIQRREPPVARLRGPVPLIADTRRPMPHPAKAEPPVVASAVVAAAVVAPPLVGPAVAAMQAVRGAVPSFATTRVQVPPSRVVPAPVAPVQTHVWDDADDQTDWAADAALAPDEDWNRDDDWHPDNRYEPDYDPTPVASPPRVALGGESRRTVVQAPVKKTAAPSQRAMAEAQPRLRFDDPAPVYELPPLGLLASPATVQRYSLSTEALEENARMLESVLDDYGVKGEIVSVRPGPVVTMYELEPAPGLKASRVIGLADDIARSMSALSARVSTVPGRTVIGIELPNATREKVVLREILAARDFGDSNMRLPLALGKDIGGEPIVANLAKMPHLLIAGTTGSGKSVAINTMILSLLYKLSPEECRLIMIDPKMLELSVYDGIPHLLSPVVTDPKKAVVALKWVVSEMEERYRKMSKLGVRNIEGYNGRVREALSKNEMFKRTIQTGFDEDTGEPVFETDEFQPVTIPYIVVVVDEMADLMMVAGKEIEACIQRLAQMARASGIHLIMATQRPSVDVITGTIKANFPTRISFQVTSKIDSRTILGEQGAEQLLGMGDMLYMAGGAKITRIHGPFVSDEEVEEIVNHLKSYGPPVYMSGVVEGGDEDRESGIDAMLGLGSDGLDDTLYDQAVAIVAKDRKCSTSYIQRKLGIGYNKAAKLVEQMEEHSVVTPANHVGKREILVEER